MTEDPIPFLADKVAYTDGEAAHNYLRFFVLAGLARTIPTIDLRLPYETNSLENWLYSYMCAYLQRTSEPEFRELFGGLLEAAHMEIFFDQTAARDAAMKVWTTAGNAMNNQKLD